MSHHIVPFKTLAQTFIGLLILTVITILVSLVDLGLILNAVLALAIASMKAVLVFSVFMGLRWDRGYNIMLMTGSFLFIGVFFLFTIVDFTARAGTDPIENQKFDVQKVIKQ